MRYGFVLPEGDARTAAELAATAEQVGWDGFFVWEAVWGVDAWVALAAAAMRTERIRLGTLLTPLPWRQPWKLASETATLDQLCGGRLILSVGLGAPSAGATAFGVPTDRRLRAELLDEGLAVLTGLWAGQPYSFAGKHYHVESTQFWKEPAPPAQRPRIPIWVVGAWPRQRSMQRALAYDGLLPGVMGDDGQFRTATPAEIAEMAAMAREVHGPDRPYDIIVEGITPGDDPEAAAAIINTWAEAGATWWIESMWEQPVEVWRRRLEQGPPRTAGDE